TAFEIVNALMLAGSIQAGTAANPVTFAIDGLFTWSGGDFTGSGAIGALGGIDLSGGLPLDGYGPTNVGPAHATALSRLALTFANGASFTNGLGGTFDDQGNTTYDGTTAELFHNLGTYQKSALPGGTSTYNLPFNNDATVTLDVGTLQLLGGGASTGDFLTSAGTTLEFDGGHTLSGIYDAAGDIHLLGSFLTLSGSGVSSGDFQSAAGTTLEFTTGPHTLSGTYSFDGDVQLNAAGTTLNLSGSGTATADFSAEDDTQVVFSNGPHTFSGTYAIDGDVQVIVAG